MGDSCSNDEPEHRPSSLCPNDVQYRPEIGTSLRNSLLDLFLEEKRYQDRINAIDQTMEQLFTERRYLTNQMMEIKLKQIDAIQGFSFGSQIDPVPLMIQVTSALLKFSLFICFLINFSILFYLFVIYLFFNSNLLWILAVNRRVKLRRFHSAPFSRILMFQWWTPPVHK